jgi:hypothetical protein
MANQSQVSDFDAKTVLDCLIDVRRAIAKLQAQDAALLARLDDLAAAGEIDHGGFQHAGWSVSHSAGRCSWDYPSAVKTLVAQANAAKKAAESNGSATATFGASFWILKPLKQP